MNSSPLSIAFLWHMHQPYYKDPLSGIYRLPWVRHHGTKDYLDMAMLLEEYPHIRQTFNLVPSLIEQLIDYTDNNATDVFLEVTLKKPSDLSDEERAFILGNFFLANWDTMIRPFSRYHELLLKRGLTVSKGELSRIVRYFSDSDFLDLQVLFNLVWIDPMLRKRDVFLSSLVTKGRGYSEEDKSLLLEKGLSILRCIIPKYRELSSKGQIELSASPYYHPILPLLCDTDVAKIPTPDIRLPKRRFSHPEDARAQIRMATDFFQRVFGQRPSGMWPSEGSVSEDIVKAIHEEGIEWAATDEDVLAASLGVALRGPAGELLRPDLLYTAHEFSGASLIFRDHKISDLIGFVYSGWEPKRAAEDLVHKFLDIHASLPGNEPYLVPVILDGENAWEYYQNDAEDFLRYLYEGLSRHEQLRTTTVSGYLGEHRGRKKLDRLHAGSWIYGNFNVWIGHEEDNTAWDYLTETREALGEFQLVNTGRNMDSAWKALYAAEGSDWNWWYGDEHSTENAEEFDELFRGNLIRVYREMGREAPPHLFVPVLRHDRSVAPSMEIRGFVHPKIDGIMTSYFEWIQGAYLDVGKSGGSMHMTEGLISRIYYGFDRQTLFIRADPKTSFAEFPVDAILSIDIAKPSAFRVDIPVRQPGSAHLFRGNGEGWTGIKKLADIAIGDILECAIPFQDIKAGERDELNFFLSLRKDGENIERYPWRGYITLSVPTPDFEAMMWY
ncbi:MAG TPA: glycoside hydrolase family 57 protein [Thermodesulfovibrionales bacterium]|nr:glycoside hydrolase family 57 protein [Thermodesulfovibrionales bacterium]